MGQYGNQPDFGTFAKPALTGEVVEPSAVFIGELNEGFTTCSIEVEMVGSTGSTVTFTGLNSGTFLPIIITKLANVVGISEDKIILYR